MISVIVTVYNIKEEYLKRCLDSIINQKNKNFELIIIHNIGSDNNMSICDLYKSYKNVKIIHKENEGVSVSRNLGIILAKGDYITFIDGDDYVSEDMIDILYKTLDKKADISIYSCFINYKNKEIINSFLPYSKKNNVSKNELIMQMISKNHSKFYPIDTAVSVPWAKLYNKNYLCKNNIKFLKGMDRMQDMNFNLYAFEEAKKINYIDIPFYHYFKNVNSVVNKYSKLTITRYEKMIYETKKYLDLYKKNEIFYKALNMKIVLSIDNYLINYFFSKENKNCFLEIKKEIVTLLSKDLYKDALNNLDYTKLNKYQKVLVFLLKNKQIVLIKILIYIKKSIKNANKVFE